MNALSNLYRSRTERRIAGVCGGLAEMLNIDPLLVRFLFLLGFIFGGGGLVLYVLLWIILPEGEAGQIEDRGPAQLYRSRHNRRIAGVCGGLAAYFGIDAVLLRALFVLISLTGGTGIIIYFLLAIIIPEEPPLSYDKNKRG